MKTHPLTGEPLPKCVVYDAKRERYRVRFYSGSTVLYLAYATTFEEAMERYHEGREQIAQRNRDMNATSNLAARQMLSLKGSL